MVGRKVSDATRKKMSDVKRGILPKHHFEKGGKHPFWKIDRTSIGFTETPEYRELRLKIFKRDNYQCQECKERGRKGKRIILDMHHIKSRKNYPDLSLDENNCITLCRDCHKKTESYLNRWK
jgi:5-methylcytosine-specific restriction protein A